MFGFVKKGGLWFLLTAGAMVGATLQPPWSDLLLGFVVLPALALMVRGARRLRGSRGWLLITAGSVLISFAPLVTEIHRSVTPDVSPLTIGDAVLMAGYGFLVGGFRSILTARTMAPQIRVALDALIISLWAGFGALAWAGPQLVARLSGTDLVASLIYLPFSLALVFLTLQLAFGSISRSAAVHLLTVAAACAVLSEFSFLATAAGRDEVRPVGVAFATLSLVLLAAAASHPSAVDLEEPVAGHQQSFGVRHTMYQLLSFAGIIAALVLLPNVTPDLAILLTAIATATAAHLMVTVKRRERLVAVEQELRQAVTDISRAESPEMILQLGALAVDRVLDDKTYVEGDFLRQTNGRWVQVPEDEVFILDQTDEQPLAEAVRTATAHRSEQASDLPGIGHTTRLGVALEESRDHTDLFFVEASPVLTATEMDQIKQVVSTVDRALVGYDRKEASHQRRSDQRFRALVHDSADLICLIDPEAHQVLMVSPSMQRILGFTEDQFVGRSILDFARPEDADDIRTLLANCVSGAQSVRTDVRLRHVDGHYHWFSLMVRDHTADEEVRGLVTNFSDIQDRKMAELSLGFSEQRFRTMVLNSKEIFAILETDLTINYISPNVEAVLGYRAGDLVATRLTNLLNDRSKEMLGRLTTGGHDSLKGEVIDLDFLTQDRQTRTTEVVLSERADGIEGGLTITVRDITEQRRLEQSLRDQALYDSLTGLANRETAHFDLQQRLQRLESNEVIGVIHLDLDEFRAVNESVGFERGDELLVQVATRLRALLRSSDTLARVGGNEFVIITTSARSTGVARFAERLLSIFEEPFELDDRQHRLSASIGIDTTEDRRSVARDLLEHATLALGEARKGSQSGTIEVFEPRMRATATERWELGSDLEGAIDRNELSVVYQPILQIDTRNIRGVEALLRWTHPDRGPVSPAVFIPIAEKTGLVFNLGRWVLKQSCDQLMAWHQTVTGAESLGMSVNVSALQLERPGEAETLCQIVLDSGVDPGRITFELTESTLIEDATWIRGQLQTLRDLGARVAVDDFGTGAAGLSHLRDVPFNVIKIDKSYVDVLSQQDEALRLIQGVIELAHTLGAETVAEGIEEPSEFAMLQSLGCDMGQGFYLGRPMDPVQLEDWFNKGRTGAAPSLIVSRT